MEQNNISEQENDLQMNEKKGSKKTDEKESTAKTILEYVISIGIAIVAALLINNFILLNAKVPSGSMENTIMTGDRLFGFRLSYLMEDPKRGDIVIFKYPDNESINYIKRIIGLPGETVTIKDSKVYINNSATPLKEDSRFFICNRGTIINMQFQVPEGCYFMMGDNRNNSKDSRYWNNTYVARDKILAKAIFRYWGGFKLLTNTADYE
mgnify:CR=1 FL=1